MNSNDVSWEKIWTLVKKAYEKLPPIPQSEDFYDEYFWNDAETIQNDAQMIWYREYAWFVSQENKSIYAEAKCNKDYPRGRSIHYNGHWTIITWVNDEDHVKIAS